MATAKTPTDAAAEPHLKVAAGTSHAATPPTKPDIEQLRQAFALYAEPDTLLEVRVLDCTIDRNGFIVPEAKYSKTVAGYFDNVTDFIKQIHRVKGANVFLTVNPVKRDVGDGRCEPNTLVILNNVAQDKDIAFLRHFYLDVDCEKPSGVSASDEEWSHSLDRYQKIHRDHPELRESSAGGESGNGYFIMVRLEDYPNDAEHKELIAWATGYFRQHYSDDLANIDEKTKNPARLSGVPGTIKCKGRSTATRPNRMIRFLEVPATLVPFDLKAFRDRVDPDWREKKAQTGQRPPVGKVTDSAWNRTSNASSKANPSPTLVEKYVSGAMAGVYNDLSGTQPGDRNDALFQSSARLSEFVAGGYIPETTAINVLKQAAEQNGLKEPEVSKTIQSGLKKGAGQPWDPSKVDWKQYESRQATHGRTAAKNSQTSPPPTSPLLTKDQLIALAEEHRASDKGAGPFYRDREFFRSFAYLERSDPAEAAAIEVTLKGISGFTSTGFKKAMTIPREIRDGKRDQDGNPIGGNRQSGSTHPQADPDALPEFDASDLGNANLLLHAHRDKIRCCGKTWFIWAENKWVEDPTETMIQRLSHDIPGLIGRQIVDGMGEETIERIVTWQAKSKSARALFDAYKVARSDERIAIERADFNRDHFALNVLNGTINLKTGELKPHDRDDLISRLAPVTYDRTAKCPQWEAHIKKVTKGSVALAGYLQRAFGYALCGDTSEHCFFVFWGNGRNGKGVTLGTIQDILGDYAGTISSDLIVKQKYKGHPTGLTDLDGPRFVSTDELEDGVPLNEQLLKMLTGGGYVTARRVHENNYSFLPRFKLFINSNYDLEIHGQDDGIWSRVRKIPFLCTLPVAERIKNYQQKLVEAEGPGILNWLIEGFREWQRDGLREPTEVTKAIEALKESLDDVQVFIDQRCSVGDDLKCQSALLYNEYKKHTLARGVAPEKIMSDKRFYDSLSKKGFQPKQEKSASFRLRLALGQQEVTDWLKKALAGGPKRQYDLISQGEGVGLTKAQIITAARPPLVDSFEMSGTKHWRLMPSADAPSGPPTTEDDDGGLPDFV